MRSLPFILVFAFLLAGCGEKIESLCGQSGGNCCAINYAYDQNGKPQAKVLSCRPSADACLEAAKKYDGTPQWNYTPSVNDERGQCEMKIKTVPFWEASFVPTATALLRVVARGPLPNQITAKDGTVVAKGEATYCRHVCLSGDVGKCPLVPLPNDIALGMLNTTIDAVETVGPQPKIFTPADILAKFRISGTGNACRRGDLVATDKVITNASTDACRTDLLQATSFGTVPATLMMAQELIAHPDKKSNVASWKQKENSFVLDVSNASLKPYYSGPIEVAGRSDVSTIFMQVRGASDISCAEIASMDDVRYNVRSIDKFVLDHPSVVRDALKALASYRADVKKKLPNDKVARFEELSVTGSLFPYRTYLDAISAYANDNAASVTEPEEVTTTGGSKIKFEDIIRALDINACSAAQDKSELAELAQLVPEISRGVAPSDDLLRTRVKIAGQVIQCKLSSQLFSTKTKEIILDATR